MSVKINTEVLQLLTLGKNNKANSWLGNICSIL